MRKNTVAATIEMEMIQKEMATGSLALRKPFSINLCGSGASDDEASDVVAEIGIAERTSAIANTGDIVRKVQEGRPANVRAKSEEQFKSEEQLNNVSQMVTNVRDLSSDPLWIETS